MLLPQVNTAALTRFKSDDFLPPISAWTRLGGVFLISAVGAAIALTASIKYRVVVKAAAAIRPTGEIQLVQATTAGVVTNILVQENQAVKQGDVIATLELSQLQTQKNILQSNLQNNQSQLSKNQAELNALASQRSAEQKVLNQTIAMSQAMLSRSQQEYDTNLVSIQSEVKEAAIAVTFAQAQVNRYRPLAAQGVISQLQVNEKQEALEIAQAKLERAQAKLNLPDAPVTIATAQIAQETAKGESAIAKLDQTQQTLLKARAELQNQIDRDQQQLQQLTKDIQKGEILAPSTGTILKLDLRNQGQLVQPGATIAQIAPSQAKLLIKARVAAQDISQVKVCATQPIKQCQHGQAQLRISAYPYPDYGVLKAVVRSIAADVITGPIAHASANNAFYEVTLEAEQPYLIKANQQYPITVGMDAAVEIVSKEESLLNFILHKSRLLTNM